MTLAAFLCLGRWEILGSLKSLLWSAPQLSRASILLFSILNPLRAHTKGLLRAWWPQYPWFTDLAGDIFQPQTEADPAKSDEHGPGHETGMKLLKDLGTIGPSGKEYM